jgi:arylsulfatase A-like enzyme
VDEAVGAILKMLERTEQDKNTLILFAGDNGWSGGHHGIWGMGDHTRPKCAFEHTMRVPLLWWQPGRILPAVVHEQVSHVDFFPSLMAHLGLKPDLPAGQKLTGQDYSPALIGKPLPTDQKPVFYEYEELRCIRTRDAKLILRDGDQPDELYNLRTDPEELTNLYDQPSAAKLQADLSMQLDAYFQATAAPEFDLWKGGRSKAHRLK